MISDQLYIRHHTYFKYDTLCSIHKFTSTLWVHTIVVTTLHPLHLWHQTHYIWYHTHDNTEVKSAISPSISDTTSTVTVSSNPGYQFYHTYSLYDITTIHVTSYTVCMLSELLFSILHTSMYNFTPTIFMTSYPISTLSPYRFHENTTNILDISPTVFDITATVSVSSHRHLYWRITLCWYHNMCVSHHTWHTYDIIPNLHPITFTLYDINDHV